MEAFGGSGDEIVWSSDSCGGIQLGTGNSLSILRLELSTSYFAKWQNHCGQSECKSVEVIITENYVFSVPNAFTPNNDGINDEFGVLTASKLDFYEMEIFNRWGQIIFTSNNQDELWNGKVIPIKH